MMIYVPFGGGIEKFDIAPDNGCYDITWVPFSGDSPASLEMRRVTGAIRQGRICIGPAGGGVRELDEMIVSSPEGFLAFYVTEE